VKRSGYVWAALALVLVAAIVLTASPLSSQAGEGDRKKVVWLSVDSANYYRMYNVTYAYQLENLKRVFSEGAHGPLQVVYPSATAVNHASLATGAPPGITGIVGNSIHLPGTRVTSTVSGFNGGYLQAEPVWVTADRAGLKTVVVSFPQSTPPAWSGKVDPARTKLFNIYDAFVSPFSYSTLYTTNRSIPRATYISFTEATGWVGLERIGSVYGAWEANITIGDSVWLLLLVDTTGYGYPDRLYITPGVKDVSKALASLSEGSWSKPINTTITYRGSEYVVAPLFKAIKLDPKDFRLYRGITRPFNTPWFNDEKLAWEVWNNVVARVGAFTDGDYFALQNRWIDVETYMETVYFTNLFFMEFTKYVMKRVDWDLLMTYTPVIDNVYHQFLGAIYPSMPYYDPSKADYYRGLIARTYAMIDGFVGEILKLIDPKTTVLIITSDHGQCPVKYLVNINAILYNAGLAHIERGSVVVDKTKAWYTGHGHIFVNLRGREDGGIVEPSEYSSVVDQIIRALQSVRDPDTGEQVFDLVMTREQARALGLTGERVGDVVIATRCGYTAVGGVPAIRDNVAQVFTPAVPLSTLIADHGTILPSYPELHGVFIAYGEGIYRGYLGLISVLNVAPTVSEILGIEKPANAVSHPLPIVIKTRTVTTTLERTTTLTETRTAAVTVERTQTMTATVTLERTETRTATVEKPVTVTETKYKTETRVETKTETERVTTTVETIPGMAVAGLAVAIVLLAVTLALLLRRR